MNNQFYIAGGDDNYKASLAESIPTEGWRQTSDYTKAHLLILNLEPDPNKSISQLWNIIVEGFKSSSCIFDYIIVCSAISENELEKELEKGLWNKFSFIRKSCASNYCQIFDTDIPELSELTSSVTTCIKNNLKSKKYLNYISRLSLILNHAQKQGWAWSADLLNGLNCLAKTKDDPEDRLDDEHDVETQVSICKKNKGAKGLLDTTIGSILAEQAVVDYYYLATSVNRLVSHKRIVVCIDDKPELFKDELKIISLITGDLIYYTEDAYSAEKCIDSMKSSSPSLAGTFCLAGESSTKKNGEDISEPDWILMDLLLKLPGMKSNRIRLGDDALKRYMERSPGTPSILLTWSEEPDVAAGALRESKACSVVSKRRIIRLPYEMENYRSKELGEVLNCFKKSKLANRLTRAVRLWTSYPGILWHGEKTYHAAEHTLEHHRSLWRLVNQLMPVAWPHMLKTRQNYKEEHKEEHLFRFLMAIWLHDIGCKGNETYQTADQIRSRHSWISGALIHRNPELYQLHRGVEADVVELLCAYHQSCAPFDSNNKAKEDVKGLFQQSLEQIVKATEKAENANDWKLMGWAALLRLLDAMDQNWQRVGIKQLVDVKTVSIEMDRSYHKDRAKMSTEAESYAKWLEDQDKHMAKHLSVLEVKIRTQKIHNGDLIFWPEYTFVDGKAAKKHLGEIGLYVLQEWYDTGNYIEKHLNIRMAKEREITSKVNDACYGVCDFDANRTIEIDIKKEKNKPKPNSPKIQKLQEAQLKAAWELWNGPKQS